MNFNLNLRKPQLALSPSNQKETPINLVVRWNNQKMVYSTGKRVLPKYWNNDKQEARKTYEGANELNTYLSNKQTTINKAFTDYQNTNNRIPNSIELKQWINDTIDQKQKPNELVKEVTFYNLIDKKIKELEDAAKAEGRIIDSSSTSYAYGRLKTILKEYEGSLQGMEVSFEGITIDWYNSFSLYLKEQGYKPNYRGKLIKNLKVIMNRANNDGLSNNYTHKKAEFKKLQGITAKTYLNEKEIDRLYNFDFETNYKFDKVKDLLVMACRTGFRVSDLKRVSMDHIFTQTLEIPFEGTIHSVEQKFIRIETKKNVKFVDVAVHPQVEEILLKYDNKLPTISNQKFLKYIKQACELAGLTKTLVFTDSKGTRIEKKQFELCVTHTGRRSFATNNYKDGIAMLSIMAITGHSKVADFMNYIILDANEHAKVLATHYHKSELQKKQRVNHLKIVG